MDAASAKQLDALANVVEFWRVKCRADGTREREAHKRSRSGSFRPTRSSESRSAGSSHTKLQ